MEYSFKFTGQEKDEETGYNYFGARYYMSDLGIWAFDPLSDKYPSLSPYAYCANNPVILIDPDGNRIISANKVSRQFMKEYLKDQFGTTKMFRFNRNGTGEMTIKKGAYNSYMRKANQTQQNLLKGMEEAIGRPEVVNIHVNKNSGSFHFNEFSTDYGSYINIYNSSAKTISPYGNLKDYHIFVNNDVASNEIMSATFKLANKKELEFYTGKSASSTFIHEVLDEFLNYFTKKTVSDSSPKIDKVHYQNDALKNKGLLLRNGQDHQ